MSTFKILSDREHVLERFEIYGGARTINEKSVFINHQFQSLKYSPGLLKCVYEIIDNAVDEYVRTNGKYATVISVETKNNQIIIVDNGRGVPHDIIKTPNGESIPILAAAFSLTKAGSNFSDDNRTTMGLNGIGSAMTNFTSKSFIAESTTMNKKRLQIICKDGELVEINDLGESKSFGTMVKFEPNYEFFDETELSETYVNLIEDRLKCLSVLFPKIKFTLNRKIINTTFDGYFNVSPTIISNDYKISINLSANEEFTTHSVINGLKVDSGTHIDYLITNVCNILIPHLKKKHKIDVTNSKLKQHLQIFFAGNNFPNLSFDSQTKERITNNISEVREYFKDIDWEIIEKQLLKNKELIDTIVQFFKFKEQLKNKSLLSQADKKNNRSIKLIEKYHAPQGKEKKYLVLSEGDSASGSIIAQLGRDGIGYYALRGVPMNVLEEKDIRISKNEAIVNLSAILGFKFSEEVEVLNYENIVFATDADLDGFRICGLLIAMFSKFCKKYLEEGRLHFLKTPIALTKDRTGKITNVAYDFNELKNLKGNVDYKKGLGTLTEHEWQQLCKDGIEPMLEQLEFSNMEIINNWLLSENVNFRKEQLNNYEFNINTI